ncbi:MAG: fructose bisphosphate aldolase [Propionibacteriaceae bacterium]|nr:fructose bisphosphate aldolase [Propionibacteriaceae bacterium]
MDNVQVTRMQTGRGFVAALDQSGGSTPKALARYGISEDAYSNSDEMFDLVHVMRQRIMSSPSFTGDKVLAAILFEQTMDRQVEGVDTPTYLWEKKQILPILKVDKGLEDEADGVRLMKPMDGLNELLGRAKAKGIFGTKMRSVINSANAEGIATNVAQQFAIGRQILASGLAPILEPEIDIHAADKGECEDILKPELLRHLDGLDEDSQVMLKLTIPNVTDFYADVIAHPRVMRVVALSGGYSREEANDRLSRHHGLIASFSRALTEGLSVDQTEREFDRLLAESIDSVYEASIT